jgi:hypothetical protein
MRASVGEVLHEADDIAAGTQRILVPCHRRQNVNFVEGRLCDHSADAGKRRQSAGTVWITIAITDKRLQKWRSVALCTTM